MARITEKLFDYLSGAAGVAHTVLNPEPGTSHQRRELFTEDGGIYLPQGPAAYVTLNAAIIDAILDLYPASVEPYQKIVSQWDRPGCEPAYDLVLNTFKNKVVTIESLGDLTKKTVETDDFSTLQGLVSDWIKRFCNRPANLKKGKQEIHAKTSPYLTETLAIRSLADYLKRDFSKFNEYRGEAKGFTRMSTNSRKRRKITKQLKDLDMKLHYGAKVKENARECVRARILSPSLREYACDKYPNEGNFRKRIRPFDDAMGHNQHAG